MDYTKEFGKWTEILPRFAMDKAISLKNKANELRKAGVSIYPADSDIFRALKLTSPDTCRVLIVGQDPYHEPGQANGLAFSVNEGVKFPPSLRNIYKEIEGDLGIPRPESGDLTRWAEQGVLLLNYTLTVEQGKANSHKDWTWNLLSDAIIQSFLRLDHPKVCLAWGKFAINAVRYAGVKPIEPCKIIESTHPSPLSANRPAGTIPAFIGSRPFSQTNAFLMQQGENPIKW